MLSNSNLVRSDKSTVKSTENHLIFLDFPGTGFPISGKENFLENWELALRKTLIFEIYPLVVL